MLVDLFDFDGVLIDSLDSHIKFYQDTARALGFELTRERAMRAIALPKKNFYVNMGFREEHFEIVNETYEERFVDYNCPVFPGVPEMLADLKQQGRTLCLVTFNRRRAVEHFLAPHLHYFDRVFTRDGERTKGDAVVSIRQEFGEVDYLLIGDTYWDVEESREANIPFLGADYGGWYDFSQLGEVDFEVMSSVPELQGFLLRR